jgi:hypothetical protein
MRKFAIVTAAALVFGMASPAFAVCDVRKADDDAQAKCAQKCDDDFIARKMDYGADLKQVRQNKIACDAKCGCPENSKDIL